jgi:hypothetical protein
VLYNDALNELIISGDQLFSLDLGTSACTTLPLRADVSPLNIQVTPTNEMLVVTFGALAQFDRATGEIVIVSK